MKPIYHFIAPLLALITMAACAELEISEEANDSINNGILQELSITGKDFIFDGETRSTVTIGESGASFTWDEDDVIGIFPDKGDQVSFAMAEGAGTQTATFSGGGWALKSSAKYAAYYPHVYENRDLTQIPVNYVGQTQNGNGNTDHIGAYDFMAAGVSTPENGAVAFDMQHLGALVQLTITVPEPSTLTKVVLTSSTEFTETGTIDLTAATPAITADKQSTTLEIALNDVATIEANEKVIVYFMTAPVDLTDSELTAKIYFTDATTCEGELTGSNLQSGMAYRFSTEVDRPDSQPNDYIDEYGVNRGEGIEIDGVVWAPVNCGYHPSDYPYGKIYQWGRKYGQGYSGQLCDKDGNLINENTSDAMNVTFIDGRVTAEEGNQRDNENIFYIVGESGDKDENGVLINSDWANPSDNSLWNSGADWNPQKTENDPCPNGWRVPTCLELYNLSRNHSLSLTINDKGQSGLFFSGATTYSADVAQLFLPAAGSLDGKYGFGYYRGWHGGYWSSKGSQEGDDVFGELLIFDSNYLPSNFPYINRSSRRDGNAVRCVKEQAVQ